MNPGVIRRQMPPNKQLLHDGARRLASLATVPRGRAARRSAGGPPGSSRRSLRDVGPLALRPVRRAH